MANMNEKKTKKVTEVTVPPDTKGTVRKPLPDGGSVTFQADVEQTEQEVEDDTIETFDESQIDTGLSFDDFEDTPEIPKSNLVRMFDQLQRAVNIEKIEDSFYALVTRTPDGLGTRYNYPCNSVTDLGSFAFSSRDLFDFKSELQRLNNNSGGKFDIRIYKSNRQPLILHQYNPITNFTKDIEIGLTNFSVTDPPKIETQNGNQNPQENMLLEYMKDTNKRFDSILEHINRKPEPSALEIAMTNKMISDLTNPQRQGSGVEAFQQTMVSMFAMPEMVRGFAEKMFPPAPVPIPPAEKDWIDKTGQALEIPAVQQLLGKIGEIAEAITIAKIPNAANPAADTDELDEAELTEMELLIKAITDELESDNPINADNKTLKALKADYPGESEDLQLMCQTTPFESVLQLMIAKLSKKRPELIAPFLDFAASKEQKVYVWTERGDKMVKRLVEFYEFVRTSE